MSRPIALTSGEPAGVGLELAFKARAALGDSLPLFLIADCGHLAGLGRFQEIANPVDALTVDASVLPVLHHDFAAANRFGSPDAANAPAVIAVIKRAVALVQTGQAAAICTNPINKRALQQGAGFAYPGHTEFLAALAGVERSVMMLAAPGLRVVPVTIHIPLAKVPPALTPELLKTTIRITDQALRRDFGLDQPRLAIAGLNPHAGEEGAMGREEIELITPQLDRLRAEGLTIRGPMSADTMFHAEARSQYDAAICMYHDQALIPLKTLDFYGGTNITLGLPFIRTSPDHGTALDIAGKGLANPSSLIAALRQAAEMAESRNR